jgi:hypothetical protein
VRTQAMDTDPEVEARLFERYRSMTAAEKLALVGALGRFVEDVAMADLRQRYPDATERENRLRLASRTYDRETMIRAFGWDPEERGL